MPWMELNPRLGRENESMVAETLRVQLRDVVLPINGRVARNLGMPVNKGLGESHCLTNAG